MRLAKGGKGPKARGRSVKADRVGGHRSASSEADEEWEEAGSGRAAQSLDGPGDVPPEPVQEKTLLACLQLLPSFSKACELPWMCLAVRVGCKVVVLWPGSRWSLGFRELR
jgi:hypothetical protein